MGAITQVLPVQVNQSNFQSDVVKPACAHCRTEEKLKKCCGVVFYCGTECQKSLWKEHRNICKSKKAIQFREKELVKLRLAFTKIPLSCNGATKEKKSRVQESEEIVQETNSTINEKKKISVTTEKLQEGSLEMNIRKYESNRRV